MGENGDNSPAELPDPSEEETQSSDIEGEEADVLQRLEEEVEEFPEDSEEDEAEDEEDIVLDFGKDPCDSCPRCGTLVDVSGAGRNISINIITGAAILYCGKSDCGARIEIRHVNEEPSVKSYWFCGV